jgi:hypothetical protein
MAKSSTDVYLPRTVRKDFPELGPDVWVEIRNPLRLPDALLVPRKAKMTPVIEDGVTIGENFDMEDVTLALEETIAALVLRWHVYDESAEADNVEIPVSECGPETLRNKVPRVIVKWLLTQHSEAVNPPQWSQVQSTT